MSLRLNVVDGGDRGQSFPLPATGTIRIGNYGGHTDICLHDLYVAKDHCHVEIADDGKVSLTAQPSAAGTLVNGAKVYQQEIKAGDVLRIGNSYLKLEMAADGWAVTTTLPSASTSTWQWSLATYRSCRQMSVCPP